MTSEEFKSINWHRGNVVRLQNGKEYLVKGLKSNGKYILLYSEEYDSYFVSDHRIVDCRTSDYEEPMEEYLELKRRKQEEARAMAEAARQQKAEEKARQKQAAKQQAPAKAPAKPKVEQVKVVEVVKTPAAAPAAEAPKKRMRQRIKVTSVTREKIDLSKLKVTVR